MMHVKDHSSVISPLSQLQQRVMFLLAEHHPRTHHLSDEKLKATVTELVDQAIIELAHMSPPLLAHPDDRQTVLDELLGLGPLENLLSDDTITEIMVNHYQEVYIERAGKLQPHTLTFSSEQALRNIVERIVAPLGKRIDEASPIVDARLADGSRVHVIIPPLALHGTALTIRKFPKRPLDADALLAHGTIDKKILTDLQTAVIGKKNILISGGTGTGKTTLLNLLSEFIPEEERVITIEEAAELRLHHQHVLRLEARQANSENKGQITVRELLRNALRMRPDRIIVGECRGAEALDMLQSMNTGHAGSLTTLHANTPVDALLRLETMVMMAGLPLSLTAIRTQIATAIDMVVQMKRRKDGGRIVNAIHLVDNLQDDAICTRCVYHANGDD
jgi:pilus assembly protein CpaF